MAKTKVEDAPVVTMRDPVCGWEGSNTELIIVALDSGGRQGNCPRCGRTLDTSGLLPDDPIISGPKEVPNG